MAYIEFSLEWAMAYDNLIYTYLVGGFKLLDYFPFHIWNVILPIDFHIFQDG